MNAPDRSERFVVPEGVKKVAYTKDSKQVNGGNFEVQREDHTMGNLIRMQLHRDPDVTFCGYKLPHPLEYRLQLKVQTNGKRTAKPGGAVGETQVYGPMEAMESSLRHLQEEYTDLRDKFQAAVEEYRQQHGQPDQQ